MERKFIKLCNILFLLIITVLSMASINAVNSVKETNVIYLDPGHGGPDGGAVGIGGVYEKDIVLSVCLSLKRYLIDAGYNVLLTRDGDYDLADDTIRNKKREDIHTRVKLINESSCLLFVSIHANIFSSPSIYGAQTFYNSNNNNSKILSEEVQAALRLILKNTKREAKSINNKYLIDNTKAVGTLVEIGFLSNPREVKLLTDEYYQDKIAYSIYIGILSYLDKINN